MQKKIHIFTLAIGMLCIPLVSAQESANFHINDEFPNYGAATQESDSFKLQADTTWHEQPATSNRFKVSQFGPNVITSSSSVISTSNISSSSSASSNNYGGNRRPETIAGYTSSSNRSEGSSVNSNSSVSSEELSSSSYKSAAEDELTFTIPEPETITIYQPVNPPLSPAFKKGLSLQSSLLAAITKEVITGEYFAVAPRTVLPTVEYGQKNSCTIFDEIAELTHGSAPISSCLNASALLQCSEKASKQYKFIYSLLILFVLITSILLTIIYRLERTIESLLQHKKKR